jgi:hypothetical protein
VPRKATKRRTAPTGGRIRGSRGSPLWAKSSASHADPSKSGGAPLRQSAPSSAKGRSAGFEEEFGGSIRRRQERRQGRCRQLIREKMRALVPKSRPISQPETPGGMLRFDGLIRTTPASVELKGLEPLGHIARRVPPLRLREPTRRRDPSGPGRGTWRLPYRGIDVPLVVEGLPRGRRQRRTRFEPVEKRRPRPTDWNCGGYGR